MFDFCNQIPTALLFYYLTMKRKDQFPELKVLNLYAADTIGNGMIIPLLSIPFTQL